MKTNIAAALLFIATSTMVAPHAVAETVSGALSDHAAWNSFLKKNVEAGRVAYRAAKENPTGLSHYLSTLAATSRTVFESASRRERLAFWINAYNAYTIKLVLDHYPVESIWDASPFWRRAFGGPFAIKFIPLGHLFPGQPRGVELTLNDIEHEILRKEFNETRIHFAIVCASTSCPELAPHAFSPETLDSQLDAATRRFLADPTKNRYDSGRHHLELSAIFKWFREDFDRAEGGLLGYIGPLLPKADAEALATHQGVPEITFNGYDWSLNDQKR